MTTGKARVIRKRYRLLREGELTDINQGDEFNTNQGWVPTMRDGRRIHAGLVGAYRRPIANTEAHASAAKEPIA